MLNSTLYRDFLFLTLLAFVAMLIIVLPFLNPPTKDKTGDIVPPGNINVHVLWDSGNTDVDLWVMGPKEFRPIGYSNKGGFVWNLVRDDLGRPDDELNYENSFSRGIYAGEYIINLHCYRCPILPVTAKIEVSVKKDESSGKTPFNVIAKTKVKLQIKKEELTVFRFKLTKDGELVEGSMNHVFKPLRAMEGAE